MIDFFNRVPQIRGIEEAVAELDSAKKITKDVKKALDCAISLHEGQLRKSGIPYVIHPICVATIISYLGGDDVMICSSLLHDVVEDTICDIGYVKREFGYEVAEMVDALTKIVEIRNEEFSSSLDNQKLVSAALSFRKMLLSSIKDVRVLVIKICDRMHNMLTLDALREEKRIRISEETLVVYAPIAHRLGISSIKNELEDKSFYYLFKNEYEIIQNYMNEHRQNLFLKLNGFSQKITK